jgi:cell division protein FtsB
MSIGSRRSRERRRRTGQIVLRLAKWLLALAIFVGLGYWSYQSGLDLARSEVTVLERRLETLSAEARATYARNTQLEGELRQSREDNAALQRRYDRDVPRGDAAALFALAQGRIAAGVPRERAAQLLRDAGPVRACEGRGSSRRFAVAYGPRVPDNAGIELLDGLVRVVVSAANQTDDLTRAATVVVTVTGQEPVTLTGLPQRHTVTLGNAELTLNVSSEIRGFATVALSTCG